MVSQNGTSPYNALFGRVPRTMVEFQQVAGAAVGDMGDGLPGVSRHVHRLREIALENCIKSQAEQRMKTALSTNTRMAGEILDLQVGSLIDFYRNPHQKDTPGWKGPSRVTGLSNLSSGYIDHEWQGNVMRSQVSDCRNTLVHVVFECLWFCENSSWLVGWTSPVRLVMDFVCQMKQGSYLSLGWANTVSGWMLTADTKKHYDVYLAALNLVKASMM